MINTIPLGYSHVVCWKFTDVSEKCTVSFFRVKKQGIQEARKLRRSVLSAS
jgi:hypothetical protein